MSKHKGILDTMLDFWATKYFIVNILPFLIIIIAILVGVALVHAKFVRSSYDSSTTMFSNSFNSEIENMLSTKCNTQQLSYSIDKDNTLYSFEIDYVFKNQDLTKAEMDEVVKAEVNNMYQLIKGRTLLNDGLFAGQDKECEHATISLVFYLNDNKINTYLNTISFEYDKETKWDASYNKIMSEEFVRQANYDKAIKYKK